MKNEKYKILLVDDDNDILEFLSYNLKKEGFKVFTAENGKDALRLASLNLPQLIILDVMMPGLDGIETCEQLRLNNNLSETIITFLTARGEDYSQIAGFEAGADDYIIKPVKPKVFVSRIKALLKRHKKTNIDNENKNNGMIQIGKLVIDNEKHTVIYCGQELCFPKKEFAILRLLTSKPEKVFTRDEIFLQIWGTDVIVGNRTIDVYIRKIREKISNKCIKTVKGVGYKFKKNQV